MMRQVLVFVLVLVGMNLVLSLLGIPIHFSIIGSLIASLLVGVIMNFFSRRS